MRHNENNLPRIPKTNIQIMTQVLCEIAVALFIGLVIGAACAIIYELIKENIL